jgi:hypothetical protein
MYLEGVDNVAYLLRKFTKPIIARLLIFIIFCYGCSPKGEPQKMNKIEINTSVENLQEYITLPGLTEVRWALRGIGKQSRTGLGPQDLEFFLFSPVFDSTVVAFISERLSLNASDEQIVYIDSAMVQALGITSESLIKYENFYQINGKVYDAQPVLHHFTTGIVALTDLGIIIIAGTT